MHYSRVQAKELGEKFANHGQLVFELDSSHALWRAFH